MGIERAGIICHTKNDDILLVMSGIPSKLGLPKGHIEGNEDLWECAIRETKEETGICFDHYDDIWISDDIQFFITHEDVDNKKLMQMDTNEISDVILLPFKNVLSFINTTFINRSLRSYISHVNKIK